MPVFASAPAVLLASLSAAGDLLWTDAAWDSTLGLHGGEAEGLGTTGEAGARTLFALLHADDGGAARAALHAVPDGPLAVPLRLRRGDGTFRPATVHLRPRHDRGGVLVEVACAVVEAAVPGAPGLAGERARYRFIEQVTDTLPDLVYVGDLDALRVTYHNRALHSVVHEKATLGTFALHPLEQHVHADDLATLIVHASAVFDLADGSVGETELRVDLVGGATRWVRLRDTVLHRAADGTPSALLGVVQDVTERHAVEDDLEELASDLIQANEALEARANDLEVARAAAEQAAEAKSAFLATMSHEIRTPLNGILGMTQILDGLAERGEHPLTDDQSECVETIRTSGQVLLTIINDVLDVSKLDAGRIEIEHRPFDLHAFVRTTLQVVRPLVPAGRPLAVRLDMAAGVPRRVVGDEVRLRQVLLNLLSNAIKFTLEGEVTLRLRLHDGSMGSDAPHGDASAGAHVAFEVCDTGLGIAPHVLPTLFQPFTQADASTTRRFGGTGLGLAISRGFVRLMGGDIEVESALGEGTTCRFSLPLPLAEEPVRPARAVQPVQVDPARAFTELRLLLVEDNLVNQKVALRLLARLGVEADVVSDGQQALDALGGDAPYDVVLMDVHMPVMGGLEAAALLHAEARPAPPYVVALSASVEDVSDDAPGIDARLGKPFTLADLEATLRTACEARAHRGIVSA